VGCCDPEDEADVDVCCTVSLRAELRFRLHFAHAVAAAASGVMVDEEEEVDAESVTAALAAQSPVAVLVPHLRWLPHGTATRLLGGGDGSQEPPPASSATGVCRGWDVELLHVHYAVAAAARTVAHLAADAPGDHLTPQAAALDVHLAAVSTPLRRAWLLRAALAVLRQRLAPNSGRAGGYRPWVGLTYTWVGLTYTWVGLTYTAAPRVAAARRARRAATAPCTQQRQGWWVQTLGRVNIHRCAARGCCAPRSPCCDSALHPTTAGLVGTDPG
jgi:hypothetical protein